MRSGALAAALWAGALAPCAAAGSEVTARQLLEMPAHRSLMESAASAELSPFTTDGCSGGLSESWRSLSALLPALAERHGTIPPWENCCIEHDRLYHDAGGAQTPEDSFAARLAADEALQICVQDLGESRIEYLSAEYDLSDEQIRASYQVISRAMFDAVRLGGVPCSGLPWRWGYGYPQCPPLPNPLAPAAE